jgi:hypothetical protein
MDDKVFYGFAAANGVIIAGMADFAPVLPPRSASYFNPFVI